MAIKPVVRYMILCEDWMVDAATGRRVSIIGLISNLCPSEEPAYPLFYNELCVFLALTEEYGQREGKIVCTYEESGQKVFEICPRLIAFGSDPLEIVGVPFRIRSCSFPQAGLYSVQF
jgi:hypothetical protein